MSIWRATSTVLVIGGLVAGCSTGSQASTPGTRRVAAAFYPLAYVTQRVGGDRVVVRNLTKPGAEPHDVELSARDVAAVQDADLVVFLSKFQAQVDDAVGKARPVHRADVATGARLEQRTGGYLDPHFWLDPLRLADVGDLVAQRLSEQDPAGKTAYAAGAGSLRTDLAALDAEYTAGLAVCRGRELVTSHTAFGYLADRYRLTQVGIAGVDPEAEPTAADQAAAVDFARKHDVHTVFTEPLVSDAIASTVAREIGGTTSPLDPIEGISSKSNGTNYLEVMRSNLKTLRAGLGCT